MALQPRLDGSPRGPQDPLRRPIPRLTTNHQSPRPHTQKNGHPRAALRDGVQTLPSAQLAGVELEIRLLVDHRDRLVKTRTALVNDLLWHLHDLWPELELPSRTLTRSRAALDKLARRLTRCEQSARVRIARDELRRVRELSSAINELHSELAALVSTAAPRLLAQAGIGTLTAAKLVGEIAGVQRFASDAKLARACGTAPIPASSGRRNRHRLDRGGNRQLNAALHRIAITRARVDPQTRAYLERRQAQGKTRREAIRCLKRHLVRRIWQLLHTSAPPQGQPSPAIP